MWHSVLGGKAGFIMKYRSEKIGIIGLGHVGPHVANSLISQGIVDEILLCEVKEDKLAAEVQDLNDSTAFAPHRVVVRNCHADYEELADCDVIVNASGQVTLSAENRDGELYATTANARTFAGRLAAAGFEGFWVNVSNPCDVVTREIHRLSGLPANHVMGTGTVLDSARLRTVISLHTKLAPESIQAYMIGEHGNSQIAAWSAINIAGKAFSELQHKSQYRMDPAETEQKARNGGYVSYHGKQCTEYAVANAAARIVRAIIHDEHAVMSTSVQLNGEYGQSGFFISVPSVIGRQGVEDIFELNLTDAEKQGFLHSCQTVQNNFAKLPPFSIEESRTNPVVLPPYNNNGNRL